MPARPRRSGGAFVTRRSPSAIVPAVTTRSPERRLIRVDLPAPFGPMTAWISPVRTSSETSATACSPPKRFVSLSARSAASGMAGLAGGERRGRGARPRHAGRGAESHLEELANTVRERQHDRDDDQAFGELPVLGERAQHLLEAHQDRGAEKRA